MRDYLNIGPTPCGEDCAQLGQDNFEKQASIEMNAFVNQLYRQFPEAESKGVTFAKKWFNHDFGRYGEVVAIYDDSDEDALNYAIMVENDTPEFWDNEARKELYQNANA